LEKAFSGQAPHFDMPTHTLANREHLEWIRKNLELQKNHLVLDVAAGTSLLGRELAPMVGKVIALEATEAMAEQGRLACEKSGIRNLEYCKGYAESLPFEDDGFDLVVCRLALHHFKDASPAIREMKRVAKASGVVSLIDLLSPEEPSLARTYNDIERWRDPSHIRALGESELLVLIQTAGLKPVKQETRRVEVDGETWLSFTGCGEEKKKLIEDRWEEESKGGAPTGMYPVRKGTAWKFYQHWTLVNAVKAR